MKTKCAKIDCTRMLRPEIQFSSTHMHTYSYTHRNAHCKFILVSVRGACSLHFVVCWHAFVWCFPFLHTKSCCASFPTECMCCSCDVIFTCWCCELNFHWYRNVLTRICTQLMHRRIIFHGYMWTRYAANKHKILSRLRFSTHRSPCTHKKNTFYSCGSQNG